MEGVGFKLRGDYRLQLIRGGEKILDLKDHNDITNLGLDTILNVMFNAGTQATTWYMGLVNNAGFSALSNSDTMGGHAGWTEYQTYDEAARPEWTAGDASSQQMTNAVEVVFTIGGTATLKGVFITTSQTKGGTTGTLWSTAPFALPVAVQDDDVLKLTYTVTAARA